MDGRTLRYRITGLAPLLMHNGQLADPLNPFAREMKRISSKRNKTDADHEQLARLEFRGSLYVHGGRLILPAEAVEAALIAAAKRHRKGVQARAGLFCPDHAEFHHEGPDDPEKLWDEPGCRFSTGVRVGQARVIRTRPRFEKWHAEFSLTYFPDLLNAEEVREFLEVAGAVIGLGDGRPRFGRFGVEEKRVGIRAA